MLLLPLIAGISLTSSAVSWWNGKRMAEVQQEIAELENEREQIHAEDATKRRAMIEKYLRRLDSLVDRELSTRKDIDSELTWCLGKAREIAQNPFGSWESGTFQQSVLELEMARSRVKAECAYLSILKSTFKDVLEGHMEIPSPASLDLPNDFPREGGAVHFESAPAQLHGYRLQYTDWSKELDGRAVFYDVNHDKRIARISTSRCALLEANLTDGGGPMRAKVLRRDGDGVHLEYQGVPFLLPTHGGSRREWLFPEDEIEVYPEIWTLEEVTSFDVKGPLRVRVHPRVDGSRKFWSPILLSVAEDKLPDLVKAYEHISDSSLNESPWRLHLLDSGGLGFALGNVTLETRPDFKQKAFVLEDVKMESEKPDVSVRFHAELSAFVPGTKDDADADRTLFESFVEAVHGELGSQKQLLLQRRSALRLRKLSLIYQDQEEHQRDTGSCGFIPGEVHKGGRVVIGTIADKDPPNWLNESLSSNHNPRLQAVGREASWEVRRAKWKDQKLGKCHLELRVPAEASFQEIDPFHIKRLERVGEGTQQQTLSKALERAILGKFSSSGVHSTLLGLSGDEVENRILGRQEVEKLLASDAAVVAIWGPPGTGKTTTLVDWLLSLFPIGREREWPNVLITAPTHVAVDNILSGLLKKDGGRLSEEVVRYGHEEHVQGTDLEPIWHKHLLRGIDPENIGGGADNAGVQRWAKVRQNRNGREAAAKWLLGPRHIHAATCVGMARRDLALSNRTFDIAIVDEAGKAFGAELFIPSAVTRRVIMVGDHRQLPPTVTTEMLDEGIGYQFSMPEVEELLRRNMFHEIFEQLPQENKGMLTMQYRMHEHIGSLVSDLFYEGKLQSHRKDAEWTLTNRRVVFVDFTRVLSYRNHKSGTSQENHTERAALRAILGRLRDRNDGTVKKLMIICPYKAQRSAVEKEIRDKSYGFSVEATTVDAVQGDEADIVILLMTRSSGRVQFLLDRHRLNVALSRARESVIVLGHLGCLAPSGKGPVAKLVDLGRRAGTLHLLRLRPKADFRHELAPQVVP